MAATDRRSPSHRHQGRPRGAPSGSAKAGQVFDFHGLRHQLISNLAAAGEHPKVAQQLARHSTITLTMDRYKHLGISDVTGAVNRLPQPAAVAPERQAARATGTDGCGAVAGSGVVLCHSMASKPAVLGDGTECPETQESLQKHRVCPAEGTGIEPATPCGAPHFQCGR